jgi:tight adherence protein B
VSIVTLYLLFFFTAFLTLELCFVAYRASTGAGRKGLRERLRKQLFEANEGAIPELIRKQQLSVVPFVNQILLAIPASKRLGRYLDQANVRFSVGFFVMFIPFIALLGYTLTSLVTGWFVSLLVGMLLGALPVFYVWLKRKKRMAKFERQLPEALELIARSLRAGHAFSSGLALAAEEFDDPLGPQFGITVDEINFGVSVPIALRNLAERVDCVELWFFVASAILQRDVGGNLAEVMETIGHIIRERFKLRGKIRTLTAEVRLSGVVLMVLPFVIFGAIGLISRDHISTLIYRPEGRIMAGVAIGLMIIGYLIMRKLMSFRF